MWPSLCRGIVNWAKLGFKILGDAAISLRSPRCEWGSLADPEILTDSFIHKKGIALVHRFLSEEEAKEFFDHRKSDADTATALATIVERRLVELAETHLDRKSPCLASDDACKSFGMKAALCLSLRIIPADLYADLMTVAQILRDLERLGGSARFADDPLSGHIENLAALRVHRGLLEAEKQAIERPGDDAHLKYFILSGEFQDKRSQFRMSMRYYINVLNRLIVDAQSAAKSQTPEDVGSNLSPFDDQAGQFESAVLTAARVSQGAAGRHALGKRWWASVPPRLSTLWA
jgi:hypothetical protein